MRYLTILHFVKAVLNGWSMDPNRHPDLIAPARIQKVASLQLSGMPFLYVNRMVREALEGTERDANG